MATLLPPGSGRGTFRIRSAHLQITFKQSADTKKRAEYSSSPPCFLITRDTPIHPLACSSATVMHWTQRPASIAYILLGVWYLGEGLARARARSKYRERSESITAYTSSAGLLQRQLNAPYGATPLLNAPGIINSGLVAVTGQSLPTTTTWPKTWSLATWEQFQRWCLNWCRHSRSPSSAPSPTAGIACGAFLHCSRWLFARPGIRPQTAAPTTTAPTTLQPSRFTVCVFIVRGVFGGTTRVPLWYREKNALRGRYVSGVSSNRWNSGEPVR